MCVERAPEIPSQKVEVPLFPETFPLATTFEQARNGTHDSALQALTALNRDTGDYFSMT